MVNVSQHPGAQPDDVAAAVDGALTPLLLLLGRATARATQRVSTSQLQALLAIEHHGALNLSGLADALSVLPSSATRLCDRLIAADLIVRASGEQDRREVVITLSSVGKQLVRELKELRRQALEEAIAPMTERDRRALLKGLTALVDGTAGASDSSARGHKYG